MASIKAVKSSKGITKYHGDFRVDGKRYRRYLGLSKQSAELALKKIEYELRYTAPPTSSEKMSYSGAVIRFMKHVELTGITYAQVKYIASRIRAFQVFCNEHGVIDLHRIDSDLSQSYIAGRTREKITKTYNYSEDRIWRHPAPSTINREIGFQKRFFRYCLDNGWIPRNPWVSISRIKNENTGEPRYAFSEEELHQILHISDVFHDFYYFLLHTGLRPTDTFVLIAASFEGNLLSVRQRKTGDWLQRIPLSNEVMGVVIPRVRNGGYIFPELQSDRQRRKARLLVQGVFEPSSVREKNINLHTFRHTYAHTMLNRGMPKEVLQTFLGHKSIRTTETYANWVTHEELSRWVS